jgi:hypothetical protein
MNKNVVSQCAHLRFLSSFAIVAKVEVEVEKAKGKEAKEFLVNLQTTVENMPHLTIQTNQQVRWVHQILVTLQQPQHFQYQLNHNQLHPTW